MVAWLTMVWELAVGDTIVLTFIWPKYDTVLVAVSFPRYQIKKPILRCVFYT